MTKLRIALAVATALACAPVFAQKTCSAADAAAAEKAVDRVVNYPGLLKAWRDYGHCDQGPVADLFTDAILRLMVEWKDVDTIAQDVAREPAYKKFIHEHLRSPAAQEDRQSIFSRAKASCPLTQGAFCEELVEVVKAPAAKKDDPFGPLPTIKAPGK